MKYTNEELELLDAINAAPVTVFVSSGAFITRIKERRDEYYRSPEYQAKLKEARERNERRAVRRLTKGQQVEIWAKDNLKIGDLVQMTGTRDSHGYRKVVAFDGDTITCHKLDRVWINADLNYHGRGREYVIGGKTRYYESTEPTTHAVNKLRAVLERRNSIFENLIRDGISVEQIYLNERRIV